MCSLCCARTIEVGSLDTQTVQCQKSVFSIIETIEYCMSCRIDKSLGLANISNFYFSQNLLLKEGVLAYVMPLLLGYDTTLEDKEGGQPAFDASTDASQVGPKFLGLGIERSNMQVAFK